MINKPNPTWENFIADSLTSFTPKFREGVIGDFKLLRQTGAVEAYFEKFEELRALLKVEILNLSESYFVANFISGLFEEIKARVKRFKPDTPDNVVDLALLEEFVLNPTEA